MIRQTKNDKNYKPKVLTNRSLILKKIEGSFNDLMTIKSTKKEETIEEIKSSLYEWMNNPNFKELKKKKLDIALVVYADKFRMKRQDVDNIAKIVLDALRKSKKYPDKPYLFEDDSQVVRLLVYKLETKQFVGYETNSLVISFREHDSKRQMILIERTVI